MMEDKRKEEIKQKVDTIGGCIKEIKLCEEELARTSEAFEFVERYWYCDIWVKAVDDEDSSKVKGFEIPLFGLEKSKVIDAIKEGLEEKLRNRINEYDDEVIKAYQELDELLK